MERTLVILRRECRLLAGELLERILPFGCAACGEHGAALCEVCRRNLAQRSSGGCRRCGAPRTPGGTCLADHRRLRGLQRVIAPFWFAGTGGRLVRRFKLDGNAEAGRFLAQAMADELRQIRFPSRPVLVPVPLHRARRRRRGFDQAQWLANRIADKLGARDGSGVLIRVRPTLPQGDVRVMSRVKNLRGAFSVRHSDRVAGRVVVLVDDVFTTGATARQCAERLRQAGARSVAMLAACRS